MAVTTASGVLRHERKQRFNANGTWVVPAGVFFATVELTGGGAGAANPGSGGTTGPPGGNSTVALSGGTVTGWGMQSRPTARANGAQVADGTPNSGRSAAASQNTNIFPTIYFPGNPVTPGASIAVTVGAGGVNSGSGGSGYVIISWEV